MTNKFEDELKKITVNDLMYVSGRGLRYNSDKLRYDLIPPLANREYAKVWTQAQSKASCLYGTMEAKFKPLPKRKTTIGNE